MATHTDLEVRPVEHSATGARTWTIRVCEHGHRVEWRDQYESYLHMDVQPGSLCDGESEAIKVSPLPVKTREDRVQQALYALELERRDAHGIGRLLLGGAQRVLLRQVKNLKI